MFINFVHHFYYLANHWLNIVVLYLDIFFIFQALCWYVLGVFFQEYQFNRNEAGAVGQRFPGYGDYQGVGLRSQFPAERKWALGLQVRFWWSYLVLMWLWYDVESHVRSLDIGITLTSWLASLYDADVFRKIIFWYFMIRVMWLKDLFERPKLEIWHFIYFWSEDKNTLVFFFLQK